MNQKDKDILERLKAIEAKLEPHATCPSCGHCPHCGRGGYRVYPYPSYPYQFPWVTYTTCGALETSGYAQTGTVSNGTNVTLTTGGTDVNGAGA